MSADKSPTDSNPETDSTDVIPLGDADPNAETEIGLDPSEVLPPEITGETPAIDAEAIIAAAEAEADAATAEVEVPDFEEEGTTEDLPHGHGHGHGHGPRTTDHGPRTTDETEAEEEEERRDAEAQSRGEHQDDPSVPASQRLRVESHPGQPDSETETATEGETATEAATATEAETEAEGETSTEGETEVVRSGPVVEARDLSIYVPGKFLLIGNTLKIERGEKVLLVGPSGVGKTVLLRLLCGLLPREGAIEVTGSVEVDGHSVLTSDRSKRRAQEAVGIVFQDHALLDELTAAGNLEFARDHSTSPRAAEATERARTFLVDHGIEPTARVGTLSGGQKQRVAVARALARDPEVVFYDEPTSSLDPRNAHAVAQVINDASEAFGKTSVVVTHNYAPFQSYGFRVVYLDPELKRLREIPWDELDAVMGAPPPEREQTEPPEPPLKRLAKQGLAATTDFLAATPSVLWACLLSVFLGLIPWGAKPRWFLRWLWHYSRIVFFGSALPYNVIAGVIAGFVATYYTYEFLPRPDLTEPLILDDILPALGFALYRIIVPVLVTILVAGRTGAALASDFGSRVYHHQTTAMDSMGAPTGVYLGTAALWASLVGVVVVGAVAFWAACLTSVSVFVTIRPEVTPFYWSDFFWRHLEPFQYGVIGKGWHWVLGKLLASAAGVCAIAYAIGTRPKESSADVSRGITLSVYWGTVFVLLVHFVTAFFEFDRPMG